MQQAKSNLNQLLTHLKNSASGRPLHFYHGGDAFAGTFLYVGAATEPDDDRREEGRDVD